jgi:hypothetical protein
MVLAGRSVHPQAVAIAAPGPLGCPDAAGADTSRERSAIDRRAALMAGASPSLTGPRAEPATGQTFKAANIVFANHPIARS